MNTKAAALKLYAKACETHKRQDWRLACHALATLIGADAPQPKAPAAPKTLVRFLADAGLAEDSDLVAMDAEIWHKGRPFQRRLVRDGGLSLDDAAQRAHDAGYFPDVPAGCADGREAYQVIDGARLLDAIGRELSGRPLYQAEQDSDYWASMESEELEAFA